MLAIIHIPIKNTIVIEQLTSEQDHMASENTSQSTRCMKLFKKQNIPGLVKLLPGNSN